MDSQRELQFALAGGASYEIGSHIATWQRRSNDEKIIDLSFRGKHFEITQEGSGPGGRPRMLINGIRRPDGRLFQGRSLLELLRELNNNWGSFVEIPARLERMERKLDTLIGRHRESKTKLCLAPITANWPQERYIPKAALGGFARVPVSMIAASQCMAAGEYRVLLAVLFCAQGTGLLTAGKKRLAKLAKVGEPYVNDCLRSLCNRQILRATGRILKYGVKEHELLTHPWLSENDASQRGDKFLHKGGQICAERGTTVVPLKTSNKTSTNKTSNKKLVLAPNGEEVLLAQIGEIVGHAEMVKNGGMWRKRIRGGLSEIRALKHAIEDYKLRTPDQRFQIRDRPAWFTDRYTRNLVEAAHRKHAPSP
jgi:hypothetical protein